MPKDFYKDIKLPFGFNKRLVERAYHFAAKAHSGQKRKSGNDYIVHPLAVARILLELNMPCVMLAAALLHDTVEDTTVEISEIANEFGPDVASLVQGVTKLGQVDFSVYSTGEVEEAKVHMRNENLRSLFLAMAEDARVVIIKLADRLHNMRTIKALKKEDQIRVARETLNIFSPLALRLGMGEIRGELEDLAFPIAYPEEYRKVRGEANRRYKAADRYVLTVKREISDCFRDKRIKAEIDGRAKHMYSLYKKLQRPEINWDFGKIYDLVALRIIAGSVEDCYRILGAIHAMYRPLPNYIRDYIASPKPNGYRSIHTSVFGPEGKIVEIQIRTREMHEEAEFGIASHLHYTLAKSSGASDEHLEKRGTFADKRQTDFLRQVKTWQEEGVGAEEFVENLKFDFLDERIYVFSPKGDIYDLPDGATPVDFAYEVHSNLGDTITGAKVNGRIIPLDTHLQTRDVVEIISSKNSGPKRDWLDFVRTSKARQHIRSYFRKFNKEKHLEEGKRIVGDAMSDLGFDVAEFTEAQIHDALSETSYKDLDSLYVAVGAGLTTPRQAMKILLRRSILPDDVKKPARVAKTPQKEDFSGLVVSIAPCCNPKKGDRVISYITRGKGLTVHKRSCPNLKSLEKERLYAYNPWEKEQLEVRLKIEGENRVGLLRDITSTVSGLGINIDRLENHHQKDFTVIDLTILVDEIVFASQLITKLKEIPDITSVKRLT